MLFRSIWYKSLYNVYPEWNRDWKPACPAGAPASPLCQLPVSAAYAIDFFARPGSGTVVAAGRDVARYLKDYWPDGTEKPASLAGIFRDDGNFYGSLPGTTSIIVDRVWSTGASFVVLANMRNESVYDTDSAGKLTLHDSFGDLASTVRGYLDGVTVWPTIDFLTCDPGSPVGCQ